MNADNRAFFDWTAFFDNHSLFDPLSANEKSKLLDPKRSREREYASGEEIVSEGAPGRALYFIGRGSVTSSVRDPEGKEIPLGIIDEGGFFGELTLLGEQPRSATVRAKGNCLLRRIDADHFRSVMSKHPAILSEMLLTLSERLRVLAERIIDIAYNQVDHKLQLFSAKLDAELKAVNSQLAASHTVFEQTSARAHEAIAGTERSWANIVKVGSAIAVALSILGATTAYFGIERFDDLNSRAEKAVSALEGELKTTKDTLTEAQADVEIVRAARRSILDGSLLTMTPIILENLEARRDGRIYNRTAKELLRFMMQSGDMELTTLIFKKIYSQITKFERTSAVTTGEATQKYQFDTRILTEIRGILQSGIEIQKRRDVHTRDVVMSFYFILACLAIEQKKDVFEQTQGDLKYYLQTKSAPYILPEDKRDFDPIGLELLISAAQGQKLIPSPEADEMKGHIQAVWNLISTE